jgi:hypothetical protein
MQSVPQQPGCKTVFLHVMKTGGTTFRAILVSIYGDGFHICTDSALAPVENALAQYECVELHLRNVAGKGWVHHHSELAAARRWDLLEGRDVFIMFRDPVDQILSHYFSMQRLRAQIEPRMKAIGVAFPETIEDFLDHRAHFNNQTAFVLGRQQQEGSLVSRRDLDEAIAVLDRLKAHVGLTERFADSLEIFQSVTGRQIPQYRSHNRTTGRPPLDAISPAVRQRIAEQSELDLELFEYAQRRFSEDLAAHHTEAITRSRSGPSLVSSSPSR